MEGPLNYLNIVLTVNNILNGCMKGFYFFLLSPSARTKFFIDGTYQEFMELIIKMSCKEFNKTILMLTTYIYFLYQVF